MSVAFADIGLEPKACVLGSLVIIGISEVVAAFSAATGELEFEYRMPTIFHDFLVADERGLLLEDEIGFVWLSSSGEERWKFCPDLIKRSELRDGVIRGETFDGALFEVRIPGYSSE